MDEPKVGDFYATDRFLSGPRFGDPQVPAELKQKARVLRVERITPKLLYLEEGVTLRRVDLLEWGGPQRHTRSFWRKATAEEYAAEQSRKAQLREWIELKKRLDRINDNGEIPLPVLRAVVAAYDYASEKYATLSRRRG